MVEDKQKPMFQLLERNAVTTELTALSFTDTVKVSMQVTTPMLFTILVLIVSVFSAPKLKLLKVTDNLHENTHF